MQREIEYRGYAIFHDGHEFVAEPKNADDTLFEIGSHTIELTTTAIDEMWRYLDSATSSSEAAAPPAWFQTWIDNGAAGRIRISKPETYEFEHLGRRPAIRRKRPVRQRWFNIASCLLVVVVAGFMVADVDGDGRVDFEDLAVFIDNLHMQAPRRQLTRNVEIDGKDYVMTVVPSPRDDCDYRIHLVANEKQSAM